MGNLRTGGIIGLTGEGDALCTQMTERDVSPDEVPRGCHDLVGHLAAGGYLGDASSDAAPRVRSAYLHVTQRCNLSCRFCYSQDEGRNSLLDPALPDLFAAIDLLAALGTERLIVSGGEPFLRGDLAEVASHARSRGMGEVSVLTNGLLVTREHLEPLADSVSCVAVAFDGCSPDALAHLRGSSRFERLVSAVQMIQEAGITARIIPTLHAKSVDDMPRYRTLAKSLGAELNFSLLIAPMGDLCELRLTNAQLVKLGRDSFERGQGTDDLTDDARASFSAKRSCGAGVRTLSVAAEGTVYPCHMLHDASLSLGNAFADTPRQILGSAVARRCRALDVRSFDTCSSCDKSILCGGGCRARALMTHGSLTAHDPYCELMRTYYSCMGDALNVRYATPGGDSDAV